MQHVFDTWQYMPHGMCLLWQPWLVAMWAGSDLLIFLSYSVIPLALLAVLRKRKDVPHSGLVVLFALFILLCGLTHLLGIVTLWYPIYPYVAVIKMATGIVSAVTAIALFRLVPVLAKLPSPSDMTSVNDRLRAEIAAHETTLASLEAKVDARTAELSELNAKLAVQAREAVHRSNNLLAVVSSLAQQSARSADDIDAYVATLIGRLRALAKATATVLRGADESSEEIDLVVKEQIGPLLGDAEPAVVIEGPPFLIGSEAAQQIGLAVHELATNARKHGFTPGSSDSILVHWFVEQDDAGDKFVFEWIEQRPQLEKATFGEEGREGFGTKLLTRIIPVVLKGQATREIEDGQFRYRLVLPVPAIVADQEKSGEDGFAAEILDRSFDLG